MAIAWPWLALPHWGAPKKKRPRPGEKAGTVVTESAAGRDHCNSILAVAELEVGAQVNRRAPSEGRKMTFIVQGVKGAGDDAVSTTVETGREALAAAIRWAEDARDVKIVGNGGSIRLKSSLQRSYPPSSDE